MNTETRHKEAVMKYSARLRNENVAARIKHDLQASQQKARNALVKIIQSVRYLARQGLSLRGHNDHSSNLF